jgi:hypothetical protein
MAAFLFNGLLQVLPLPGDGTKPLFCGNLL